MLSQEQKRRIAESLSEVAASLEKWETRKTFDAHQEAQKQNEISLLVNHRARLLAMLESNQGPQVWIN